MTTIIKNLIITVLLAIPISASAQNAKAWITSPASNKLMQAQPEQAWGNTVAQQNITINPTIEYQTIDGFGWMLTEGSAMLLSKLEEQQRKDLLNELYNPQTGLAASIVRIAIGACDLSESDYTYSPAKDETLANFSLQGPDYTYVIPVLKEILEINPDIKVLATPWTAPIWMKTNNSYIGGQLNTKYYALYAKYFAMYIQAMKDEGIDIWAITPQNEPLHDGNNPSMKVTKEQEYDFVENYLGPELEHAGFGDVKIIGYDHNCDNTEYPIHVAKSKYICGTAFHLYGGNISAMKTVYQTTKKDVYFTEQYTGSTGDFGGDFSWHMQNVMLGSVQNYSRCAIEWNLASDPNFGPHTNGGSTVCKGALTINGSKLSSRNVSYYIVGQMSKAVRTGAKRIATTGATRFQHSAFVNPDGSIGVVAFNKDNTTYNLSLKWEGQYVNYSVPGNSAITILIPSATEDAIFAPEVSTGSGNDATFNILGQKVGDNYKGIAIRESKKIMK